MKLFTALIALASSSTALVLANSAWADVPSRASVGRSVAPEVQSAPSSRASQLGTSIVPSQNAKGDRSQQLSQQAATINQNRPVRSGQRRDPIQQVLGLPETVRIRPTRSGLGVTTQF
ncbi:MAG: hypothetical protein KME15_08300 [Drouetiella hepatica Uher 2000/2452]|jgi:hypothetical protein|uniref:Uncharacterized protein n=1 Tax=Drouetiella hepatica Uher 2000/2452 TaxID=904376 RepID=A0A951QA38_9CYAN|nr:hypothetical protein [Drouetiella hepatica Uher 2000/2452]